MLLREIQGTNDDKMFSILFLNHLISKKDVR